MTWNLIVDFSCISVLSNDAECLYNLSNKFTTDEVFMPLIYVPTLISILYSLHNLVISLETGKYKSCNFVLLYEFLLIILDYLQFYIKLSVSIFFSGIKFLNLIVFALNLLITWSSILTGKIWHPPMHEYEMTFRIYQFSLISFNNVH